MPGTGSIVTRQGKMSLATSYLININDLISFSHTIGKMSGIGRVSWGCSSFTSIAIFYWYFILLNSKTTLGKIGLE